MNKIKEIFKNFLDSLDNNDSGYSFRKLLSGGFFILTAILCIRYTDKDNLTMVITVLTGMITALIITYTVGNFKERTAGLSNSPPDSKPQENG